MVSGVGAPMLQLDKKIHEQLVQNKLCHIPICVALAGSSDDAPSCILQWGFVLGLEWVPARMQLNTTTGHENTLKRDPEKISVASASAGNPDTVSDILKTTPLTYQKGMAKPVPNASDPSWRSCKTRGPPFLNF